MLLGFWGTDITLENSNPLRVPVSLDTCPGNICLLPQHLPWPDLGLSGSLFNTLLKSGLGFSCQVLDWQISAELGWEHQAVLLLLCLIFSHITWPLMVLRFLTACFPFLVGGEPFLWLQALPELSPSSSPQGRGPHATVALTSASHSCTAHHVLPHSWKW